MPADIMSKARALVATDLDILAPSERKECTMENSHEPSTQHHGYMSDKENYLKRMGRIEGQARGISKMIDDEKYCIDILTQISALTSALEVVALALLDDHLKHCVVDAAKMGEDAGALKIKEASDAIARLVRS